MDGTRRKIRFLVNGAMNELDVDPGKALVDVLRDDLQLRGTHVGCRNGDCGACTVLIDGSAFKSCLVPCHRVADRPVETLEGLGTPGALHPVQRIFWESNAFQCGFCLAGSTLCTVALLRKMPEASVTDLREALAGNLCRCTGYENILVAAVLAAEETRGGRGV